MTLVLILSLLVLMLLGPHSDPEFLVGSVFIAVGVTLIVVGS